MKNLGVWFVVVCCMVHAVVASSLLVVDKINFPSYECLGLPPVNQFYYPMLWAYDTDHYDFCDVNALPQDVGVVMNTLTCTDFLCPDEKSWDLTNSTQRTLLGVIFNHCFYCNNSQANAFRTALSDGTCQAWRNTTQNNQLTSIMNFHCNGQTQDVKNLAILDYNFFNTEYFQNRYQRYVQSNINASLTTVPAAIKDVKLSQLLQFYFTPYQKDLNQSTAPLNVPVTCWCNYQQDSSSFGFQCGDFYQSYQTPFVYRYSVIFYFLFYGILTVLILMFVLIPRCVERVKSFKERSDVGLASKPKKALIFIPHLFDIVTQPPLLFFIAAGFGFLENFFRFLFNFAAFEGFYNAYFPGVCRGVCAVFMVCGYSSLVISWSHVIDMSKMRLKSDRKGKAVRTGLSVFNKTVLITFYVAVVAVLILSAIVYAIVGNYGSAWIVLTTAVLIYLLTFGVGFGFYGVKILYSLGSVGKKKDFMEYRFTKFILAETTLFFLGWIVTFLALMTYILGFDGLSLFYGITRNIFMDASLSSVIFLSPYIMFNEDAFGMVYGKKAQAMWNSIFSGGCKQSESHEEVPKTPSATPHIASESTISRVDSAPESTFTSTPVDTTPTASVLV